MQVARDSRNASGSNAKPSNGLRGTVPRIEGGFEAPKALLSTRTFPLLSFLEAHSQFSIFEAKIEGNSSPLSAQSSSAKKGVPCL